MKVCVVCSCVLYAVICISHECYLQVCIEFCESYE